MRLSELVEVSNGVAAVSGRLDKIARLASLLQKVAERSTSKADPTGASRADEIATAVAFLTGSPRQGRIGVGGALLSRMRGVLPAGEPTLDLHEVDAIFSRLATTAGPRSAAERKRLLNELFGRATSDEQDFLVRLLFGELRQGALEGVLLEAIARAAHMPAATVRRAAMMAGDLPLVAHAALVNGEAALSEFIIQVLRPVQPMLAETAETAADALARLGEASFEYKMDGARIQVHKLEDEIRVFTRNLRDVTPAVPEVVEALRLLPVSSLVLDGEVIALRPDGTPQTFQTTMKRFGRRLDVEAMRSHLPLTPFFFDCLYADGVSLLDEPQSTRFERLRALVGESLVVPSMVTADAAAAQAFLDEALRRGHEGVMAKSRVAPYAAGKRGQSWLKIKNARTLDLVVLAAEWGNGRRRGWLSNLHLGARDEERGGFVMLGKTFKGLTDETLDWQTRRFLDLEVGRDDMAVYVRPELVVEIAFNDLQVSPHYPGGLALRFARVKGYRPDKAVTDADTFATVQSIFQRMTGETPPPRR